MLEFWDVCYVHFAILILKKLRCFSCRLWYVGFLSRRFLYPPDPTPIKAELKSSNLSTNMSSNNSMQTEISIQHGINSLFDLIKEVNNIVLQVSGLKCRGANCISIDLENYISTLLPQHDQQYQPIIWQRLPQRNLWLFVSQWTMPTIAKHISIDLENYILTLLPQHDQQYQPIIWKKLPQRNLWLFVSQWKMPTISETALSRRNKHLSLILKKFWDLD